MPPINGTEQGPGLGQGDDVTKNLLGGITPFLALLGQSFTNTYLSQSISICDWIVFAAVPTGVPFAVSAILRISKKGDFLRAFAVYPEEENKFIELELLSSTSEEVCEIWNGNGATRKIAPSPEPPISEWIFDGTLMPSKEAKDHVFRKKDRLDISASLSPKEGSDGLDDWVTKAETELPPNLIMNLGPYNRVRKLYALTALGVLLQSSIMVLTGLTAFQWPNQFFSTTRAETRIAPPLVWAGTLLLTFGLLFTARTIDTSARIDVWEPTKQGMMVIWKQWDDKDFHTECYVIGKVIKKELISTHRRLRDRPSTSWSFIAAVAISVGFIAQGVGISLMHWPVQSLQLLSMFTMFLGRCFARSQDPPDFVEKLEHDISDAELLELAQKWRHDGLCSK